MHRSAHRTPVRRTPASPARSLTQHYAPWLPMLAHPTTRLPLSETTTPVPGTTQADRSRRSFAFLPAAGPLQGIDHFRRHVALVMLCQHLARLEHARIVQCAKCDYA